MTRGIRARDRLLRAMYISDGVYRRVGDHMYYGKPRDITHQIAFVLQPLKAGLLMAAAFEGG